MRIIYQDFDEVHDVRAKVKGFIEIKRLTFFEKDDELIPSDAISDTYPVPPCLVWEVFDEDLSTQEFQMLKLVDWIKLTEEQAMFFEKYFEKEELTEEDKK